MSDVLRGRSALVTGAGRGIGRATALELARSGADLVLVARSGDELETTAVMVRELGSSARVLTADLSVPEQVAELASEVRSGPAPPVILVNNAGVVAPLGPSVGVDPDLWALAMVLNVTSVARLTLSLVPGMIEAGWGRVMNVSSGVVAAPAMMVGGNAYVTSKAALEAHTVNLAAELAGTGVTVNAFRPGAVDTAMQEWIRGQDPDAIGARLQTRFQSSYERGELITPEASATALVTYLGTDVSGRVLDVSDTS